MEQIKKIRDVLIKNWQWVMFFIAIIIFVAILEDVFEQDIMKLDTIAHNILVESLRADWLTKFMWGITNLGGIYILPIIGILSLIFVKEKKIGMAICCNLILVSIFNIILKNIVQRPRPEGYRLITETGYSFPSGHSMISTAFYGLIVYFLYNNIKNKKIKYILCTLISTLIVLIAISRVYLGVHYASDVVAGFLVSIAYLVCFITIYNYINKTKKEKN